MYLSNKTIKEYIENGKIAVIGDINIETVGITMHLGNELLIPALNQVIDPHNLKDVKYIKEDISVKPHLLTPNEFVLGSTKEILRTDKDILTLIDGRSTYARLGISIHISAMSLDGLPFGLESSVLEIKNNGNNSVLLYSGEAFGTYLFAKLSEPIEGEKNSPYKNQIGVTPPMI